jgi:plastocyanin
MAALGVRWHWLLGLGLIALFGGFIPSSCSDSDAPPASTAAAAGTSDPSVTIRLFQYQPASLHVAVGATVTWANGDDILHTVTSGTSDARDGRFDGRLGGSDTSHSITFAEPGAYAYFCSRHESMRGEIRVQ